MKYFLIFILILVIGAGCKPKLLSGQDLKNKLIETMSDYLNKNLKPGVTFTITNVIYYPEVNKKLYDCQFNVSMNYNKKDTSGIMTATITNDFKEVKRTE